ncbi:hypothetical protein BDQ12DRAFT_625018 [Crucibulum laeve]|uniref:VASt domain-containing protein n=1 Tax=Crucibulum laeve TaxID=68775 RepID=A0A5C3ME13_9AGAR|nr:hypothetical protein BDQ12DRAFT_625018 [Crucibulum laeve]
MAPNFLSKFVTKVSSPAHTRDRSDRSFESPRSSGSPSPLPRSRTVSTVATSSTNTTSSTAATTPNSSTFTSKSNASQTPRIQVDTSEASQSTDTFDSESTNPNVTVIPPSPLVHKRSLESDHNEPDRQPNSTASGQFELAAAPTGRTISPAPKVTSLISDDRTPTPTPTTATRPLQSRPTTPVASTTNVAATVNGTTSSPALESNHTVRRQASAKSLNNVPPPISTAHARAATVAASEVPRSSMENQNPEPIYATMSPIVESPTALRAPEYPDPPTTAGSEQTNGMTSPPPQSSANNLLQPKDNSDTKSFISTNGSAKDSEKKRGWRRGSANTRKPSGLASAIAASGLAMANPTLTAAQAAAHQAQISPPPPVNSAISNSSRKSSNPGSPPYMSRSPPGSSNHVKNRSADLSPRSKRSRSGSAASPRKRTPSVSVASDGASEYYGEDRPEYYSGLDEGSSDEEDDSGSEDDLMDLDLGEEDIPVTGFAVASNKRNADFHELFPTIPEGDYLIEDYGCALQREILIQGRLYISENHICFHANIFGWITDLSIPIYEITTLEKKMTAFVIPNAIGITTRQAKYTFASFLSRDTTYDVIYNIWRLARPDDLASIRGSIDVGSVEQVNGEAATPRVGTTPGVGGAPSAAVGGAKKKATQCACGKEGQHYSENVMDVVVAGTPERIHNLMFASGFMKDFMSVNQKLLDIQMSDWQPTAPGSKLLARNMSYIKPLNGSLGPKQTKCEIRDEMQHADFDDYVSTITTTRTPDVPSGGVFSVKTRTCIMWASAISSRVLVTTQVEWTGRSFIKGIIERSAIDGQKVFHGDLDKAMRGYIQEHQSEFIPEGMDPAVLAATEAEAAAAVATPAEANAEKGAGDLTEDEKKQREHERNRRGLQWAWDTFDGAYQVALRSTKGALELIRDGWEQSSPTTILYFIIVLLVFSNLWTLMRMGSREEAGRRKELRKLDEREKWVQSVVTALWDELAAGRREAQAISSSTAGTSIPVASPQSQPQQPLQQSSPGDWKKEVAYLHQTLDSVEERVKAIRESLAGFESLSELD